MDKHLLSKSTFIRGAQCLKSLYLNKKRPFLRDPLPEERRIVFRRGHEVGALARGLFPGGISMEPGSPFAYARSVQKTKEMIAAGQTVIYEAAFSHEQILVFIDILVHDRQGWHACEVKSSGALSDTYFLDAALQYHVISGSGLDLKSISLVYLNVNYTMGASPDLSQMFLIRDVTENAIARSGAVIEQIAAEKAVLQLKHSPPVDIGPHCHDPYTCDFIGHCWKNLPEKSVFDIPAMPQSRQFDFHRAGRSGLEQIDIKELEPVEQIQAKAVLSGTPLLDPKCRPVIPGRENQPTAFVKALFIKAAIPILEGTHPYQPVPVAVSWVITGGGIEERFTRIYSTEEASREAFTADISRLPDIAGTLVSYGQKHFLAPFASGRDAITDLRDFLEDHCLFLPALKGRYGLYDLARMYAEEGETAGLPLSSDELCAFHYLQDMGKGESRNVIAAHLQAQTKTMMQLYASIKSMSDALA
jgi:hypothetical protein